ncbi:MAG: response regulator [Brevundimonas sp.]|nr:response regulator [Brevundimonas sp.]
MLVDRLVHIVDADASFRAHGAQLLRSAGYVVRAYDSGEHFLRRQPDLHPGCVLLDIHMPEPDGLAIQDTLIASGMTMPVILFTGDNDIELAVRAMRAGALHFLEKPYADADLLGMVAAAFKRLGAKEADTDRRAVAEARLAQLSPREMQVMEGLLAGQPNKLIANALGVSIRTVEMHRLHMMEKLQTRSQVAIARLWSDARGEMLGEGIGRTILYA